jgi:hypothetical protein
MIGSFGKRYYEDGSRIGSFPVSIFKCLGRPSFEIFRERSLARLLRLGMIVRETVPAFKFFTDCSMEWKTASTIASDNLCIIIMIPKSVS